MLNVAILKYMGPIFILALTRYIKKYPRKHSSCKRKQLFFLINISDLTRSCTVGVTKWVRKLTLSPYQS